MSNVRFNDWVGNSRIEGETSSRELWSYPATAVTKGKRKTIGWREWVSMPDLGVTEVKAKVDTGADHSSLHAFNIERFEEDGVDMVRFEIHPRQRKRKPVIECVAPVARERKVKNPGGRSELRPVIRTRLIVAGEELEALVNLTTRDEMTFRMLLGRRTVRDHFVVDPGRSYIGARPSRSVDS